MADRDQLRLGLDVLAPIVADTGGSGEDRAVEYLLSCGYVIEDRRYRAASGEIDIVARQGSCWVFVEVKSTSVGKGVSRPEARLGRAQRRRVIRAARHFLRFRTHATQSRFDVISVDLSSAAAAVEHWTDAFTADD